MLLVFSLTFLILWPSSHFPLPSTKTQINHFFPQFFTSHFKLHIVCTNSSTFLPLFQLIIFTEGTFNYDCFRCLLFNSVVRLLSWSVWCVTLVIFSYKKRTKSGVKCNQSKIVSFSKLPRYAPNRTAKPSSPAPQSTANRIAPHRKNSNNAVSYENRTSPHREHPYLLISLMVHNYENLF